MPLLWQCSTLPNACFSYVYAAPSAVHALTAHVQRYVLRMPYPHVLKTDLEGVREGKLKKVMHALHVNGLGQGPSMAALPWSKA